MGRVAGVLAPCFGLPMTDEQATLYRQHTGRQTPLTDPAREAWLVETRSLSRGHRCHLTPAAG